MLSRRVRHSAVCLLCLGSAVALSGSPLTMKEGDSRIEVTLAPGHFDLPQGAVLGWISKADEAIVHYYGQFPVKVVRLCIYSAPGEGGVSHGTTFGWGGAHIRITVGEHTTQRQLDNDWMLTHEFVHLAFPDMAEQHHWIEEGIATYVEPIARAQAGALNEEEVWRSFVRDMPQGEPEPGDRGLDYTHTWGRTYWGGALFCLTADVRIREATSNRVGLQQALRGILTHGGNIESHWPLSRALEVADQSTGTKVLTNLYAEMKAAPVAVDLTSLWSRLGVEMRDRQILFNNSASLARVRQSIARP